MKKRILYIEDNEQNLYLVRFLMESAGYEMIGARDAQEGIDRAIRCKPDLILLDIQLPVMDGYSVARKLRSVPDLAVTPIVALTSYAMPGDREKCMAAGCTGYIEKPIDPGTFVRQVEENLQGRPGPASRAA